MSLIQERLMEVLGDRTIEPWDGKGCGWWLSGFSKKLAPGCWIHNTSTRGRFALQGYKAVKMARKLADQKRINIVVDSKENGSLGDWYLQVEKSKE